MSSHPCSDIVAARGRFARDDLLRRSLVDHSQRHFVETAGGVVLIQASAAHEYCTDWVLYCRAWRLAQSAGLPGWIFPGAHPGNLAYPHADCEDRDKEGADCRWSMPGEINFHPPNF